jgi:hypothetical protein
MNIHLAGHIAEFPTLTRQLTRAPPLGLIQLWLAAELDARFERSLPADIGTTDDPLALVLC